MLEYPPDKLLLLVHEALQVPLGVQVLAWLGLDGRLLLLSSGLQLLPHLLSKLKVIILIISIIETLSLHFIYGVHVFVVLVPPGLVPKVPFTGLCVEPEHLDGLLGASPLILGLQSLSETLRF